LKPSLLILFLLLLQSLTCTAEIAINTPHFLRNHTVVAAAKALVNEAQLHATLVNGNYLIEGHLTLKRPVGALINDFVAYANTQNFTHDLKFQDNITLLYAEDPTDSNNNFSITILENTATSKELVTIAGICEHPRLHQSCPSILKDYNELQYILGTPFFSKEIFNNKNYSGSFVYIPKRSASGHGLYAIKQQLLNQGWKDMVHVTDPHTEHPDEKNLVFLQNDHHRLLLAETQQDGGNFIFANINSIQPTLKIVPITVVSQ